MSSATASRWFLPDSEYYALESDYAAVNTFEKIIRREIDIGNNESLHAFSDGEVMPLFFCDLLGTKHSGPYDFATPGRMLWADVDDSKPEHKKEVQEIMKTGLSLNNYEEHKEILEEILPFIAEDPTEVPNADDDLETTVHKEYVLTDELRYLCRDGVLKPRLLNILLKNFKDGKKEQLIGMFTQQSEHVSKRPLMVLVGMIGSMFSPNPGEKNGWAIGYDVLNNKIICKPFFSDKEHHPLTSSWYSKYSDLEELDHERGVCFTMMPKEFIENFLIMSRDLTERLESGTIKEVEPTESKIEAESDAGPHLESDDPSFPWRLLTFAVTARFVKAHWPGFVESQPDVAEEEAKELYGKFRDGQKKIKKALDMLLVPVVPKKEKADKKLCLCAFEEMEWQLEEQEEICRRCAVFVKEQGHEKVAENAANLYEKLMNMIKSFNEDPEKDI